MPRLSSRRSRSLALLLWAVAVLLPQGARGPIGMHLRSTPRPGHVRLRTTRSRSEAELEGAVLGHARASAFDPGTNLRGDSGGAAWLFLLPSLELGTVLCVGAPSAAALRSLTRLGDEVVVCGGRRERWTARRRCARAGVSGVRVVPPAAVPAHADLVIGPAKGDPRVVAADGDAATIDYLERVAGPAAPAKSGPLRVPAYVQEIAAGAGIELSGHRVGLAAPGGYASRKAVMFLFRGGDSEPEIVVKLAQDPRQNERLENEWRALRWLAEAGLPAGPPRPLFFGHHAGVALLGESAVRGWPFRGRTSARPDCPLAGAALDWLLELGATTAHPAAAEGEVAAAIRDLACRFDALYRLTRRERAALERHIDALSSADIPLVLQHGDPGVWNVLVDGDGGAAFLDWEAAERHGMPLWDVFYFARSFAVTVARAKRRCTSLGAVRRELLAGGPVSRLMTSAVERQCADVGLDASLVEPLFVTCWMHRALKEATRLPPARLDSGHYVNLLRLTLS